MVTLLTVGLVYFMTSHLKHVHLGCTLSGTAYAVYGCLWNIYDRAVVYCSYKLVYKIYQSQSGGECSVI